MKRRSFYDRRFFLDFVHKKIRNEKQIALQKSDVSAECNKEMQQKIYLQ